LPKGASARSSCRGPAAKPKCDLLPGLSCDAPCVGKPMSVAHIELELAGHFDDGFRVVAVLEQRVFDGLGAGDESAVIEVVLFLGDPIGLAIAADEDEGQCSGITRWGFGEFHVRRSFRKCFKSVLLLASLRRRQAPDSPACISTVTGRNSSLR